ncbi:hypothetical protein NQ318_015935 [Aromia moschata]|uniref:Uncharacterized protein n=1 Tax=Aromia moschata TaxID=1265417 RepID=A0AAV8XIE9_9CUCU|nr:hypothetical protein NQ318_015935 [Aromia moschata]
MIAELNTPECPKVHKIIDEYKLKLRKCEDKNYVLQNTVDKLRCDNKDILKKEDVMKDELEKNKRYHLSKQSDLQHLIKKLTMENQRLREMLGKDLNTHVTRDDVTLQLIKKYKSNEEVFKNTIQKLQENNKYLLNEIIDLKMDESCKNKEDTRT